MHFTKGTGIGYDYTYDNSMYTPWYFSRNNSMSIVIDKDITYIGNYTFRALSNATVCYKGSRDEWDNNVKIGQNNSFTISQYNYSE